MSLIPSRKRMLWFPEKVMSYSNTESRARHARMLVVALLIVAAIAIKIIYLNTAESGYNAEELPLSPMSLVAGGGSVSDVAATRLYGTGFITTALSLKAFGFSVFALKAPNILFFFLSLVFLYLFGRRFFSHLEQRGGWYALMPATLLCLGPPVIQIWGMKNRGGFIENILALVVCLWICASAPDGRLSSMQKLLLAIVIGLATWSQPIAVLWGVVIVGYVLLNDLADSPRTVPKSALIMGAGLLLGLMPLLALNFLFNFNTVRVIEAGEVPGGVDLGYLGRLQQLIVGGVPRLLGLKEQWSEEWIIWQPAGWLLYAVFMLPSVISAIGIVRSSVRDRRVGLGLALVAIAVSVIAANVLSSWGNFQLEPRRLLLLYIPLVVLTAHGLLRTPKLAIVFLALWVAFNCYSNSVYISKNPDGFAHPVYRSLDPVADLLARNNIDAVYADVWTGGRITFASEGRIPWYRSRYLPTNYGFVGDTEFDATEAMIFNANTAGGVAGLKKFNDDAGKSGIRCAQESVGAITVIHHCDRKFDLSTLGALAPRETPASRDTAAPREVRARGEIVIGLRATDPKIVVRAGTRDGNAIVANGSEGYLIYGPYLPLSAGRYSLVIEGQSSGAFEVDVAAKRGEVVFAESRASRGENPGEQILKTLQFALAHDVADFEVRIRLPANSNTRISGYRVISR